ncbi:MAG: group III truncated hemoglobin [Kofleriaceae bacterium]|nr:group III truncated hemoglobin [Kofleriaceae bacterium]
MNTMTNGLAEVNPEAKALGIDQEFVSDMVDTFYSHIREHEVLGPIFGQHIGDWEVHLPKMKAFWASVALGVSGYSGRPMPAHLKLRNEVNAEHFSQWLTLFRTTLEELSSNEEVVAYFMLRAKRIAQALQNAMFSERPISPGM